MITEIIEKNIKAEYLRKYCKQLRDSIQCEEDNKFKMTYEERKEFDDSEEGKKFRKIETAIWQMENKVQELQKDILNTVLEENGFEKIEGHLYINFKNA